MFKLLFTSLCLFSFSWASLFTVTDQQGNIVQSKEIEHTENAYLNQKATEYSLQAIYDELHRAEYLARMAESARLRADRIAQSHEAAKKVGKTYQISEIDKQKLLEDAKYFNGGKYVWGGTTPEGFDCSGYVQYLYKKHNINLPRTAWEQSKKGQIVERNKLQKGDLLFFLTDKKRGIPITHVGIYIGNGKFIHAASKKKGIIISPLTHGSYAETFVSARRVTQKV
ncbi:MAG: C40 family peptidase [Sulfurovum sp.]|uniref:C40 family peptidase n=1 Tax=Sulfurovum sp. TaxID=1969726 RepID=UPI002867D883|nr:C40 family peptidase [Sulfurovum sp.]MCO4844495.1 C40 family peptidase [Sulfurovum sp.]